MGLLDGGWEIVEFEDASDVAAARAVLEEPGGTASRSDELLADGEVGLRFFDAFGPLYAEYTAQPFDVERDVRAPYRRLAGIDFASLRGDAEAFQAAGLDLSDQVAALRASFAGLASHWRGDAASEAAGHVIGVLDVGGGLADDTAALGRACGHLADALEETIRSCARATLGLHATTCATGSPVFVETLVDATRRTGPLQDIARRILDEDFVPTFEHRLRVFRDEIVTGYGDDVRALWSEFHRATSGEQRPEYPARDVPAVPEVTGADPSPPVMGVPHARRDEPWPQPWPPGDAESGTGPAVPLSGDEPVSTQTASAGGAAGDAPIDGALHRDGGAALGHAPPDPQGGASLGTVTDRDRGGVHLPTEVLQEAWEKLRRALAGDRRDR